jgi:hypothetical protein
MGFALSTLAGFIAGVLGTLTVAYLQREGYLFTESRYLLLEHKTVPSDLLRYVQPGTSVANMREMLGAPLAETEQTYRYKFDNLYLEAESEDGITIDSMTLVLPSVRESDKFPIPPLDGGSEPSYVLGELRLGEVAGPDDDIEEATSSKHGVVWVEKYYGNPGHYRSYLFGVFNGPSAPYDMSTDRKGGDTLLGDPDDLVVNLVTITGMGTDPPEKAHFDFYTFR